MAQINDSKQPQFIESPLCGITSEDIERAVKESPIIRAAVMAERERCALCVESLIGTCVQDGDARDEVLRDAIELIRQCGGPVEVFVDGAPVLADLSKPFQVGK